MPQILLVEDDAQQAALYCTLLEELGHEVTLAVDAASAATLLADHDIDVVVLDPGLPDLTGMRALGAVLVYSSAPVIVLTADRSPDRSSELIRAGATDHLIKGDVSIDDLARSIRMALDRSTVTSPELPDDPGIEVLLDDTLNLFAEQWPNWDLWFVAAPRDGRWTALGQRGDASLASKGEPWHGTTCGRAADEGGVVAERGATDCRVSVPVPTGREGVFGTFGAVSADPDALLPDLHFLRNTARTVSTLIALDQQRRRAEHRETLARAFADRDALTELPNRNAFERVLALEEAESSRYSPEAGVVFVDLDDLKAVNDRDGHPAGDDLIRRAADVLRSSMRASDVAYRIGGDEFAVVAIEAGPNGICALLNRLRGAFGAAGIRASIGSATRGDGGSLRGTWEAADEAMYEDKQRRKARSR